MMVENKRGGARQGAGRKPQGKKKRSIRLCPEAYEKIEKISEQYNMTKTEDVEMALKMTHKV